MTTWILPFVPTNHDISPCCPGISEERLLLLRSMSSMGLDTILMEEMNRAGD